VIIERAVISWAPYDFFGIRAGRFVTPFGIWNVDHSPTLVIPIRLAYIITMGPNPLRQTGVEAFGSVIPVSDTYLEYSVSLSNGRGPTEQIYDLDNNKALGLRLKGTYEIRDFSLALGGYLYWGTVTDVKKNYFVDKNGIKLNTEPSEQYEELGGSGDITINYEGFTVQGEYGRRRVQYSVRPAITYPGSDIVNVFNIYWPDYIDWNAYGLVAYEFDFTVDGTYMAIIPFAMYEYNSCNGNVYPQLVFTDIRGGLTYRPITDLSIKYEISYYTVTPKRYVSIAGEGKSESNAWENQIQLALSF
jgi:hypothetical protein